MLQDITTNKKPTQQKYQNEDWRVKNEMCCLCLIANWRLSWSRRWNLIGTICPTSPMTLRWAMNRSSPRKGTNTCIPARALFVHTSKKESIIDKTKPRWICLE
jgi:hypothetical protein